MNIEHNSNIYTFDGLDATGKTTLLNLFKQENVKVVASPPDCIKQYRSDFDKEDLESRFLYYIFGNIWIDRNILKPSLDENCPVLVDRSMLTTLASHELRGLSEQYLEIGFNYAKTCIKPRTCYIIHVNKEERFERLSKRVYFDEIDKQNLAFEETMEPKYQKWADRLGWNVLFFDNSGLTPKEAYQKLSRQILNH